MSCSPALKWFIALLLPLTLGWKLTVRPDDPSELIDSLVEFFARHHFDILVTEDSMGQSPAIQATAGERRFPVSAKPVDPSGQTPTGLRDASHELRAGPLYTGRG